MKIYRRLLGYARPYRRFILPFFIFTIIACTAYSLLLVKKDQAKKAKRFDMLAAQILLFVYVMANLYFVVNAASM